MTAGTGLLLAVLITLALVYGLEWWLARGAIALAGQRVPAMLHDRGFDGDGLVWFHSPTCGPCRRMKPHIEELAAAGLAQVIDVTETPELARACRVMATPTTLVIRDARVVRVLPGFASVRRLDAALAEHLGDRGRSRVGH